MSSYSSSGAKRRPGRRSDPSKQTEQLAPPGSKKQPRVSTGSMPKMPDLVVPSSDEDGGEEQDKKEENKMAEIIIKLEVAKQKAAESKKRKRDSELRLELFNGFVKENGATVAATRKQRVAGLRKLAALKTNILVGVREELQKIQDVIAKEEETHQKLVEGTSSIHQRLQRASRAFDSIHGTLKQSTQTEYMAAKSEIEKKMLELERVVGSLSRAAKDDNFSTLLTAALKTSF